MQALQKKLPILAKAGNHFLTMAQEAPLHALKPPSHRMRNVLILLLCLAPTLWAISYYAFFASDRYVSVAGFVVRNSTRASASTGLSQILKMIGISSSQDDTFAVHDFITSRDAVDQLSKIVDLRGMYGRDGADRLSRFPNLFYGESAEEFTRYLKGRIAVVFNPNTGISTLTVEAYTPEDAHRIASLLLELGEKVINRMNRRIHDDSVRFANSEVQLAQDRLRKAQLALTEFRNSEMQIDPGRSSFLVMELANKLSDELGRLRAQIAEISANSPDSPQKAALERRAEALAEQIAIERGRMSDSSDGLAKKISRFEELTLEREFGVRLLASAMISLDTARGEARRQQLYLERVAGPNLADKAMMPRRIFETMSIFAINIIVLLIGWLIRTGVTEHAPQIDPKFK